MFVFGLVRAERALEFGLLATVEGQMSREAALVVVVPVAVHAHPDPRLLRMMLIQMNIRIYVILGNKWTHFTIKRILFFVVSSTIR